MRTRDVVGFVLLSPVVIPALISLAVVVFIFTSTVHVTDTIVELILNSKVFKRLFG